MKMKKNVQNKNYRRGWRLLAVIGMLLCLPLLQLKAQEMRTITGLVVDQKGEILPGATVKAVQAPGVKTLIATSTDLDGKFKLNIPSEVTQIEVTFVGYKNQQVALKGKTDFKIVLTEDTQEMEEVVVTGMFTRKANSYTGSVTTIKGDELKTVGNGNVLSSLKNIDPSFLMVENLEVGSNPNAIPDFQMRGQTGFTEVASEYQENPNQPLFILDGFETTLTKIMDLDMNQVQSVTLLKDATAKAIYGSKAANGVVVVETIRPEKGKMKITYTGSLDIEAPDLSSYDLCNAEEKLRAEYLAGFYTSSTGSATEQMNLDKRYTTVASAIAAGVDTYWLDKPLRVGVGQKHSLYLEGGDDYMLYGIDLSYNNVAGVMKGSNRNTLSGGITFSYKYKNLLFRNKFTIDDNKSNDSPYGSFSDYAYLNPYNRLHDEDGEMEDSWTGLVTEYNYLKNGLINTRFEDRYTTFTENFYAEYQALQNLRLTARFGLTKKNSGSEDYYPAGHTNFVSYTGDNLYKRGSYSTYSRKDNNLSLDLGAAYSISKLRHTLFLNAQYSMSRAKYDYYTVAVQGLANDNMDHISMGVEYKNTKPTGSEGITRDMGFTGSLNYSFDDRYLLDVNYRLNGSSDFGTNNRWGHFYSFGLGWNLHKESFFSDIEWIERIKFRASTGYTGSQGFNSYDAIATLNYYQSAYQGELGSYLMGLANPDLAWQKKYDNNIGADLSFLQGAVNVRFDYYVSTTKGTITSVTTPPSMGFSSYMANLGEVENKGWEVYLNGRIWRDTPSRSYVNFYASAANKNILKKISNSLKALNDSTDEEYDSSSATSVPVRYEEGQSMSTIWVVKSLGIDPQTGKEVFVKKDGSLTYDWSSSDFIAGGDTRPKVSGNFGINMEYHGFGLNAGFTWRLGGQMYNTTLLDKVENADVHYNVDRRVFTGRWSEPGQVARFKSITDDSETKPTSRFVEDYNLLTFSSLNVYYDFRECRFMEKSFLQRMKATFYMNDIATISSVKTERGTSYPFARSFSFSLQVTF
jgi:TonB-linked SusC/RagA family outer membrane protein